MAVGDENSQGDFNDYVVEGPERDEILNLIREMKRDEDAAKTYRKNRRDALGMIKALNLPAGTRLRVGPYTADIVERAGGGFEIPKWERNVVGPIREAE